VAAKPEGVLPRPESKKADLQDVLLICGIALLEIAAAAIWWPSALILGGLLCLGFVCLIEHKKHGNPEP
jgi:hypothetical protein